MSRWFRHYAGLCRDDKLVRVAIRSKQTIERVVWVWSALLESASEVNDGGRYDFDAAEAAWFLRADENDLLAIVAALEDLARLDGGRVAKWSERQFSSDTSAERQRRYRERHANTRDNATGDTVVTSPSRHRDAPETETETDTDLPKEEERDAREREPVGRAISVRRTSVDFLRFWTAWPNKVGKPAAEKSFARVAGEIAAILAGVETYIRDKPPDRPWLNPATFLNQRRWEDAPAAVVHQIRDARNAKPTVSDALSILSDRCNEFSFTPPPALLAGRGN